MIVELISRVTLSGFNLRELVLCMVLLKCEVASAQVADRRTPPRYGWYRRN